MKNTIGSREQRFFNFTRLNPARFRFSLRFGLMALLGGMLLITIFVIGAGVLFFIYRNEQNTWQGRQAEAAHYAANRVAAFIDGTQNALILVSLLNRDTLAANPHVMNDLLNESPALLELVRLDKNGEVLAGAYQDAPLLANLFTIPQSIWCIESRAGHLHLGNIQISADSEPYLIIARPANDGGVIAARLRMNILWDVVAGLHFGSTGQTYVVNSEGQIIAHTHPQVALDLINVHDYANMPALVLASNQIWTGSYVNFEGVKVVGVAAPVPGTTWEVITELPAAEAYATSRVALMVLGSGMIVFGLLVMWVTSKFLSQFFLRPMEKLQAGVGRIAQGELNHQITIDREDEIGAVAMAFNDMTRRLHERDAELAAKTVALIDEVVERRRAEEALRRLNEDLENLVSARTAELRGVNESLQTEIVQHQETEDKLRHAASRQALLYHVLRAFSGQIELDTIARSTVDAIVEFTGWPHVCFAVPNQAQTHWVIRAAGGVLKADVGLTCTMSQGVIGRVFRTKQTQIVTDVRTDPDYKGENPALLSELTVPIKHGDRVLAVLNLEDEKPAVFGQDEQQLAESLAEAIALSLENARLFETAQIELAQRQQAQAQIAASLEEKEVLLKEIHHRVKNNLQIISSLLDLQANHISDQNVLEMFKESQGRVRSMALIHEQLYQSSDLARIDFAEYLRSLVNHVRRSYLTRAQAITINLNVAPVPLSIETAIPCGLIINELLSNAFKYAFPDGHPRPGEINIALQHGVDNRLTLLVQDNGIGIPENVDIQRTKSLGLRLVNTLVKQLKGSLSIERSGGARFEITFSL